MVDRRTMKRKKNSHASAARWLFLYTALLSLVGLIFVFEGSIIESYRTFGTPYALITQQLFGVFIGIGAFALALLLPSKIWTRLGTPLYIFGIICLSLVFLPIIGLELNGARRWINLGFMVIQPVELLKFCLIASFAHWFAKKQNIRSFLFLSAIPLTLLLLQPDFGSTLLVGSIAIGIIFVAGGSIKKLLVAGLFCLPLLLLAIFGSSYRLERVKTFFNPSSNTLSTGFHVKQITLAFGHGGLFGQGIGNSQQKQSYLPESSTDSIFAIVGEELGFVGTSLILILFTLLFFQLYKAAMGLEKKPESRLVVYGILFWFAGQTFLNLLATVGLIPLTGEPLPFFSYGRSSLIMILFASGVAIRVARENT
ncbi:MAG: hypothetical protein COU67_01090 [Candidatus Pacebacteria bacterium CG10_big_fil_rev_8_21_14_0_10_44_54]|nr:MAG: hypothetical protein COU67_01090 [Candidatus Pacebacteria bacterium CG10_big_fil_rev_8_21_14_0_10_44_54]